MKTVLITDSSCDLSYDYLCNNDIKVIPFPYSLNGEDYIDDFGKSISYEDFYNKLRNGAIPSTSQISTYIFEQEFKKYVAEGYGVIYIGFSSALSQTFNNSIIARNMILEEFPSADISVIDSKGASVGLGAIVFYANNMLKQGKSKDEVVDWIENNKLKSNHWFIIDSLEHIKRGGRISATTAAVGTILDVKPLLNVDNEGKLQVIKKIRGRKKAIRELIDEIKEIKNPEEQTIFINHGDCLQDAEYLKELVLEEVKVKDVMVNYVGPIIGSHTGPGMLCLVFMGEGR
jgi:DegV family protein with EDD domain